MNSLKTMCMILTVLLTLLVSCHNGNINGEKANNPSLVTTECPSYDSLLTRFADEFEAVEISLDKSLTNTVSDFLNKVDTTCLRTQREYEYFIAEILAKQYLHHLQCCNQGYDLLSMKKKSASIIVREFQVASGMSNPNLEMLNSGVIVDFIEKRPNLKTRGKLSSLLERIKNEQARIEKRDI
jgi:hypothetical protein